MILNGSRGAFFMQCRRKTYNMFQLGLASLQTPDVLTIGGAYHKGAAVLTATKNRELALEAVEAEYRERIRNDFILAEEMPTIEKNIELSKRMLNAQADMYEGDDWTLLQPEVEFCVPLPNTTHHCIFVHEIFYGLGEASVVPATQCTDPRCFIPHHYKGRTDGLLSWKGMTWILERKTSTLTGDLFWNKWHLDAQPTGYIYGTWKGAGIKPHGFILEKVTKPRKNAKDPFHIEIEREPFMRTDADLLEFERDFSQLCHDYEQAYTSNTWYKNTASCYNYNRKCYYFDLCKRNQEQLPGEFRQREKDYVDLEYYKLLGLPLPTTKVEVADLDADSL